MDRKKLVLLILDGWGYRKEEEHNAVWMSNPTNYKKLLNNDPWILLDASEENVGLPKGQMGNSEVGHTNIGAGRIVYQDFLKISKDIESGNAKKNKNILNFLGKIKNTTSRLHLMGLLSDGGVHSHIDHFKGMIDLAIECGIKEIYIHALMDGRDTPPTSGKNYIKDMQEFLKTRPSAKIADIIGRFYAMDRDKRWDRVQKAWDLFIDGKADLVANDPMSAMSETKENDEFITPIKIRGVDGVIKDGDGVFMMNFRADRMREIVSILIDDKNDSVKKTHTPKINLLAMTEYDKSLKMDVAYPSDELSDIFAEVISKNGLTQLRIAETEKYAHVTYFFNGGREEQFKGEERKLVSSPRDVATYDLKPQMSVYEVEKDFEEIFRKGETDVVIMNFANPDMVGHTGVEEAAINACRAVDDCLGKVIKTVEDMGAVLLLTADHGNSEQMWDYENNEPHTAHTLNPVTFIVHNYKCELKNIRGKLADIAPTMLKILGIEQPKNMNGECLIK